MFSYLSRHVGPSTRVGPARVSGAKMRGSLCRRFRAGAAQIVEQGHHQPEMAGIAGPVGGDRVGPDVGAHDQWAAGPELALQERAVRLVAVLGRDPDRRVRADANAVGAVL